MSSVPDSRHFASASGEILPALLRETLERLFRAADASSVLEICETALGHLGLHGALRWLPPEADSTQGPGRINLAVDPQNLQMLVWEGDLVPGQDASAELAWLGRLAGIRLRQLSETGRLYESISRLAMAERLQRALYAIAELAGTAHNMAEMMQSLHSIVGMLMYAENFYIFLYDPASDSVRFPYYMDTVDQKPPAPDENYPLQDMRYSLTWNLLQSGQPVIGSVEELARQFEGRFTLVGPACEHWLGVPLLRGSQAVGGIVVQSYRPDTHYTHHDRDLLNYVAQHMQTALERREAHAELERRVADRTAALRATNRVLRQQVLQRQRGERLQSALFRIAELASAPESQQNFYAAVHRVVGGLIYARNFYIALLDDNNQNITFPYSVDEIDTRISRPVANGATEYVLKHGKPLLADGQTFERLAAEGECVEMGTKSVCWLGVPLMWDDRVKGVLAVQSYSPKHIYDARDQELLTFVSYHIANALQRKQTSESLKQAYINLERRVTERTRALALANRDLREQIAERERVERRLMYETLHDSLTGLPNRTLLLQRLGQALQAYHADTNKLFAVLFIDLDRFKVINDSVGHLIGDDLLFQAGSRIRACLKTRDLVARLGGDEFAVLLEGISDVGKAKLVAERIIAELHVPFRLGVKEIFTSASIGIALPGPHYQQPEELLRDADAAMYRAKDEGRHRAAVFDDRLRREVLSLLEMEGDLRRALSRNEFVPFYQPIVALEDGRTVGYEALLRWHHPVRGLLCPGDFLAVAEENGSAESIDWQIFEQIASQVGTLAGTEGFVSLNVSGRHFRQPDLDDRLLNLLSTYRVNPRSLRIEVTERTLLENPAQVKRMLDNLRQHGVSIALDDFGTGYSSLSYLHQYPIETLKIDRSFIIELAKDNSHSVPVVRAIQVLADSLQMQVIAEGIEDEEQRRMLRQIGCRFGQGFLFAEPRPVEVWVK
ncbi:bifunctional diguanylate cyclase/phosphodiesterase [Dyella sp.]|uniref:bifunctional diguanylate cyclase/phosphodiesterase n=1 Tax=Dyella sp. TaxID=1869338 RepID=UPI002B90A2A7|nr:EAL domain-containing protein [Dyella sp.]